MIVGIGSLARTSVDTRILVCSGHHLTRRGAGGKIGEVLEFQKSNGGSLVDLLVLLGGGSSKAESRPSTGSPSLCVICVVSGGLGDAIVKTFSFCRRA